MRRSRAIVVGAGLVAIAAAVTAGGACSLVVDTDKLRGGALDGADTGVVSGDSLVTTDDGTDAGFDAASDGGTEVATDGSADTASADTFVSPVIGKVYIISGNVEGKQSKDHIVADLHDDGTLSPWTLVPGLPAAASTNGTTVIDDKMVYVVGVDSNGDSTKTVRFATLDKGVLSDWALDGSFPRTNRGKLGVAGITGVLFGIGGADVDRVGVKEVLFAALDGTGMPGTWSTTAPLPSERYNFATAQWKDHVWVMGGGDAAGAPQPTVFHAKLTGTGIASWDTLDNLSFALLGSDAVVAGDHVYLLGGYGAGIYQKVWYAPISATGVLGAWVGSPRLMNYGHAEFRAVAIGTKFLCAFGGADSTLKSTALSECAPLSSTGVPGDWKPVTPLPLARDFHTGFGVAL